MKILYLRFSKQKKPCAFYKIKLTKSKLFTEKFYWTYN